MVEDWQQWVAPGAAWVLTYLIHSTLLIAAIWLISRRLEGRPAALDALWKTALVGGLLTATLQTAAGVSPIGGRLDLSAGAAAAARPTIRAGQPGHDPGQEMSAADPAAAPALDPGLPALASRTAHDESRRARAGFPASGHMAGASRHSSAHSSADPGAVSGSADASASDSSSAFTSSASDSPSASSSASAAAHDRAARAPAPGDPAAAASAGPGWLAGAVAAIPRSDPAASSARPPSASSAAHGADARLWLMAGFLAWAVLALVFGLGLARSWWRLRRVLADRRPIRDGQARDLLDDLVVGVRRRIRLSASTRVDVPIAIGVLRPEIVLPERALVQLESAELETMLAHELAHLIRRDPAWRLITGFIHRVLFLQPLNRVAATHLESASEVLCDDWAVERTDRPLALARCLTEVAGWVASPLGASVPAMARRGSGLGRRVRRLVAAGLGPAPRRRDRWPVPLAAGTLALVVFAAPGATEMASPRPAAPMPPAPRFFTASASTERPVASAPAPATAKSLEGDDDKVDAHRLLEELRAGHAGGHDVSDWLALAQLLGSPDHGGLPQLAGAGNGGAALVSLGGVPWFSADDIQDLVEGAVAQALNASGIDDLDFDVDVDSHGGIDIHVGGVGDVPRRVGDDDDDDDEDEGAGGDDDDDSHRGGLDFHFNLN
ncbi:MAG TPA: M56 family metallopeptidase, partial [Kofleriaceae bacterium]|nr:M56 family metallopeptidase [Kofleriaceae bacterium]